MSETEEDVTLTTTIPEQREWVLDRPGNINFADPRGSYPGCRLMSFATEQEANEFFTNKAGLLVVDVQIGGSGRIFMMVSKQMDDDELEEFQEYGSTVQLHMRQWREARDAKKAADKEAEQKAEADEAAFLKEAKQAMKEIADLRKAHEELKAKYADIKKKLLKAGK